MGFAELLLTALALSMDAFSVAICLGLSMKKPTFEKALLIGIYFGIFQAIMPLLGYYTAKLFSGDVSKISHWLAFALLLILGCKMIIESFNAEKQEKKEPSLKPAIMIPYAIATSIDALAIGVSFAFLSVRIIPATLLIGTITLLLSLLGAKLGGFFGLKFKAKAEFTGGLILILIGIKILLGHFGIINF